MATFTQTLRNIFYFLLLLTVLPPLIQGLARQYTELLTPKTKVGVISLKTVLYDASTTIRHLKEFFADKEVRAILIKMDCPGGAAGSSQALFLELRELKKNSLKPVIVLVENMCASGGYYVACAADYIIAAPSSFVGSIGVYIARHHFKQFVEQFKIGYSVTKSGTYKTMLNPLLEDTVEQKKLLQGLTHDTYDQFVSDVAQSRHLLDLPKAHEWADGKIFTGRQALNLGLIDELGSLSTAERVIKEKAPIEGEIEWIYPPQHSKLLQMFFGNEDAASETFAQQVVTAVFTGVSKQLSAQL